MITQALSRRLSYTDSPLTEAQSEQLIRILTDTSPPTPVLPAGTITAVTLPFSPPQDRTATFVNSAPGSSGYISNEALARAQGILDPVQLQALSDLQQTQQIQAAAMESMRAQRASGANPPSGGSPAPAVKQP